MRVRHMLAVQSWQQDIGLFPCLKSSMSGTLCLPGETHLPGGGAGLEREWQWVRWNGYRVGTGPHQAGSSRLLCNPPGLPGHHPALNPNHLLQRSAPPRRTIRMLFGSILWQGEPGLPPDDQGRCKRRKPRGEIGKPAAGVSARTLSRYMGGDFIRWITIPLWCYGERTDTVLTVEV